ncbi:hypothetical protein LWI29_009809 [Acer saccharum]|uniref:Uncharacterized protein n=1 Tax=Acer saccharum TaxID=4024 RepID=A0AA39S2Q3_ACESA|nr:hypothetical protein LWI29_009809 [Acer saccharum]
MVLDVIQGDKLEGFINGTKECPLEYLTTEEDSTDVDVQINPEYENLVTQDHNLLGWLYNSIDIEVASKVIGNETSFDLWKALETLFGVQTRSNIVFFKKEFRRMQKGGMKMSEYLKTIKKIADNLALASQPVGIDDLVSQVLFGLDSLEYNPIVCQINERENISWMELQSKLLSYERLSPITSPSSNPVVSGQNKRQISREDLQTADNEASVSPVKSATSQLDENNSQSGSPIRTSQYSQLESDSILPTSAPTTVTTSALS